MARRWTEHQPRKANILDAQGVNDAYDAYKGWINGGIDRTSIVENTITYDQVLDYALLKVTTSNNIVLNADYQLSAGGTAEFKCLDYENYTGGWQTNTSVTITGLREGMLHVEFSCWVWHQVIETLNNPKYSRWRLLWNNQVVAQTAGIYNMFHNPYLMADVPIAGGSGTLILQWAYAGVDDTVDLNLTNQFMFGGGNLYIQAVWR